MGIFKKELLAVSSLSEKSKILDLLCQNQINYHLKTEDISGGGAYSERRLVGSFGEDLSVRFIYHIYVSRKDYEKASFLLGQNE